HSIVGFAMYYFTYDPWIGKLLYLEDFFVMSDYRGFGIGSEILKNLSQVAMKCLSTNGVLADNHSKQAWTEEIIAVPLRNF
ncbi:Diamine acetyltransferase 1, partial [Eschrichtius robustus]|nr:Diamine acetyltransferase 1 [Eschrichtius robustus]